MYSIMNNGSNWERINVFYLFLIFVARKNRLASIPSFISSHCSHCVTSYRRMKELCLPAPITLCARLLSTIWSLTPHANMLLLAARTAVSGNVAILHIICLFVAKH